MNSNSDRSLYPQKKGKLVRNKDDFLFLINEQGKAYYTNDDLIITWQLCCGTKSIKELRNELSSDSMKPVKIMSNDFEDLIYKLKMADLLFLSREKLGVNSYENRPSEC